MLAGEQGKAVATRDQGTLVGAVQGKAGKGIISCRERHKGMCVMCCVLCCVVCAVCVPCVACCVCCGSGNAPKQCAAHRGHRSLAVNETVILMTPPFLSRLKRLLKAEGGAAEWQSRRRLQRAAHGLEPKDLRAVQDLLGQPNTCQLAAASGVLHRDCSYVRRDHLVHQPAEKSQRGAGGGAPVVKKSPAIWRKFHLGFWTIGGLLGRL